METTTRRQFKSRMDAKQDVWRPIDALMGNGNGVVEVPGQPGYVYIRTSANDLGQAFNNRCPLYDNLAISCGYDPITDPDRRIFQVLSVRMADYANAGNAPIMQVANHHLYHEFGGGDDVYVDWRRLLGFRVGRPSAFTVTIDPGVMMRAGAWIAIAAQTVNLAASQPGGVNSARYVLVALDNTGTITTSNGAIVAAPLLDISDCPVPAAGEIPLAAVRLYTTQTQINDTPSSPDIIDLRFPTTYTTGGSNVYGSGVANRLAYWSAADTLTSSAEMQHLTAVALYIAKALTTIVGNNLGIQSYCTSTIAVDQAGSFIGIGSNMIPDGAADYTGSLENFSAVLEYAGAGSIAEADGYRCRFDVTAAGTIADAKLFRGHIDAGAAGTITLGHGIYLEAPIGSIGTFYGVYIATLAAATNKWAFYSVGDKITTKQVAAAGIELDPNAATGNFTLSLSPANLTGNHRVSFGDVTGTAALGAGTLTSATTNDVTVANHTHEITGTFAPNAHDLLSASHGDTLASAVSRGSLIYGNATPRWAELDLGGAAGSFLTRDATDVLWSGFYLTGTPGNTYDLDAGAGAHELLSATHADTLADNVVDGDVIIGNVTPAWSRLAIAVPAANVRNVLGVDNGELRPSWKTALDGTNPTTIAEGAAAAPGTSLVFSHRDHTHGAPATWAATAHAIDGATHTVAGRTAGQVLIATAAATFGWSGFLLDGTAGGKTVFDVTNTKTLTFTVADDLSLTLSTGIAGLFSVNWGGLNTLNMYAGTLDLDGWSYSQLNGDIQLDTAAGGGLRAIIIPSDGTLVLGTGTQYRLAVWSGTNTISDLGGLGTSGAILQSAGAGANPAWSGFYFSGTAGGTTNFAVTNTKTLTLTTTDDYNLTIPATGTAALLGTANVFTANQTISSAAPSLIMTDTTGGAKSLTIAVDANVADLRESAGAAASLLQLDLANNTVGIMSAAAAGASLTILPTTTATAGSIYGVNDIVFTNPGAASSATYYGYRGGVRTNAACAQNLTGSFRGIESNNQHLGSGTLTNMYGVLIANSVDTGVVTTGYGLYVAAFSATTGGSFGTSYAIYTAGTEPVRIGGEVRVLGDTGGVASANTITGASNLTANSTGVGTILFKGATSRNSAGFIKIYIGTTAYYVPVFSAITG